MAWVFKTESRWYFLLSLLKLQRFRKTKQVKIELELELEKGVTMTPKRRSILSALFFYLFLS